MFTEDNDEPSSCLEKRELSVGMCEERSLMWTLHRAVILKGNHVCHYYIIMNNVVTYFSHLNAAVYNSTS